MKYLFPFVLLFALNAFGMEETFEVEDDFPAGTLISQLANITLLVGLLVFTQRKTVAQAFRNKKENFLQSVEQASAAKQEAENKLNEVKTRLTNMKSTYQSQVTDARKNADDSYKKQVENAKEEALRISTMATTSLEFEVQRQIENLRVETFKKSAGLAEKNLESKLTADQQKAWNSHFISNKAEVH